MWFEVSQNTGRVHMHQAADGSSMLGLSLPMELLLMEEGPSATLDDMYRALDSRLVELWEPLECKFIHICSADILWRKPNNVPQTGTALCAA